MIQFNLLPDVKLEYIKAQRTRRLVFTLSTLITVVAVALLVGLLVISGLQKKHLNDLSRDIDTESRQLKAKPQIDKILTVQNQLASLTDLHATKPAASNLFNYLQEVTPVRISISNFHIDFAAHSATITGSANTLSEVNKYVDTLKFTTYTSDTVQTDTKAFSDVVLASFGLSAESAATSQPASYSITFTYDPNTFDITQKIKLKVPAITTTRSSLERPADLFQAAPAEPAGDE